MLTTIYVFCTTYIIVEEVWDWCFSIIKYIYIYTCKFHLHYTRFSKKFNFVTKRHVTILYKAFATLWGKNASLETKKYPEIHHASLSTWCCWKEIVEQKVKIKDCYWSLKYLKTQNNNKRTWIQYSFWEKNVIKISLRLRKIARK